MKESTSAMRSAAQSLLPLFEGSQRQELLLPFEEEERFNWHFVPRRRRGVPLGEMSADQQEATRALLRTALSAQGQAKVENILLIEGVLDRMEGGERSGRGSSRDPGLYYLTLFGEPSATAPWGWRFEGHHLSLNFSSVHGLTAGTPAFFGANPAEVPDGFGPHSGLRTLADEEDLGRKLIRALDDEQRATAIFSDTAPREIITGASRQAELPEPAGLPFSAMNREQRVLLRRLVATYVDNLDPGVANGYWSRIEEGGWEEMRFAWAGGMEPGEGHYYRIHGPTLLIEYDNVQNNANHVHSVLRDLENDWGVDYLRRHYEEHQH